MDKLEKIYELYKQKLNKCELTIKQVVRSFETKVKTLEKLKPSTDQSQIEADHREVLRYCMDQYSQVQNEIIFTEEPLRKLLEDLMRKEADLNLQPGMLPMGVATSSSPYIGISTHPGDSRRWLSHTPM